MVEILAIPMIAIGGYLFFGDQFPYFWRSNKTPDDITSRRIFRIPVGIFLMWLGWRLLVWVYGA
jgi:hypothetical protein